MIPMAVPEGRGQVVETGSGTEGAQLEHPGRPLAGGGRFALGCKLSKASIDTLHPDPSPNKCNNQRKPELVATAPQQLIYSTLFPTSVPTLLPKPSSL